MDIDQFTAEMLIMAMHRERLAQAEERAKLAKVHRARATRRHSIGRLVIRLGTWIVGADEPVLVWERT